MKRVFLLFCILFLIRSCGTDMEYKKTMTKLSGSWVFEKEYVDTVFLSGVHSDTTILHDELIWIFTDSSYILTMHDNSQVYSHSGGFIPPDLISFTCCPEEVICQVNCSMLYRIHTLDNENLILELVSQSTPPKIPINRNLYFIRN